MDCPHIHQSALTGQVTEQREKTGSFDCINCRDCRQYDAVVFSCVVSGVYSDSAYAPSDKTFVFKLSRM